MESYFDRTLATIGQAAFDKLQQVRVILFGAGGVGGWCAEALIRTGVTHLTIVDFDTVNPSNVNRQLVATRANIGQLKVNELRNRLLLINPDADISAQGIRYGYATDTLFDFNQYDYVIDAIDSVPDKAFLLYRATASTAIVFSSMGAGRKIDTSKIQVSEFRKVEGCPLARALRAKMKKEELFPKKKLLTVWSPELSADSGTIAPVVGVFGFTLADLVIRDVIATANQTR